MIDPLAVEEARPALSWKMADLRRAARQTAYQILVASDPAQLQRDRGDCWDSGRVAAADSAFIPYGGRPLQSRQELCWKVRIWDQHGAASPWSRPARWRMGLLERPDWTARWIGAPRAARETSRHFRPYVRRIENELLPPWKVVPAGAAISEWVERGIMDRMNAVPPEIAKDWMRDRLEELQPAPLFRREFILAGGVTAARLYLACLGIADLRINGQPVHDRFWDPADTDYEQRIHYTVFDVARLLRPGANALACMVGDGWYAQSVGFTDPKRVWRYGDPALLLQLEIEFADGRTQRVATDTTWTASWHGPVVKNNLWSGEVYDARRLPRGWDAPGFRPASEDWTAAEVRERVPGELRAQSIPPLRVVERTQPRAITSPRPGVWVVDFGRIVSGTLRVDLQERTGAPVFFTFGQSLTPTGETHKTSGLSCGTYPIGLYVCGSAEREQWVPRFTRQAFRYVQVEGLSRAPVAADLEALFLSNDLAVTSDFACSDPFLNQLHRALERTGRANLTHKYTDTPSRERTGWLTWPNFLLVFDRFDSYPFFRKLIADMATSAKDLKLGERTIPQVGPGMVPGIGRRGSDFKEQIINNVLVPWELYVRYGDARWLERHYPIMRATLDYCLADKSEDGLVVTPIGDWHDALGPKLDLSQRPAAWEERGRDNRLPNGGGGYPVNTPPRACGTAHTWLGLQAMTAIARILGRETEAQVYALEAAKLGEAYNRAYFDPTRQIYRWQGVSGREHESQGLYSYALHQGFVPPDARAAVAQNLVRHIERDRAGHFSTGQLTTDRVLKALTLAGQEETAYRMLTVEGVPGFKHMLSFGTETTWETWGEAIVERTPAGSAHLIRSTRPQEHIQFTAVDSWFFECILGLRADPAQPGYAHFFLEPYGTRILAWAKGGMDTVRGRIGSEWQVTDGGFTWKVIVPANSRATLLLPTASAEGVTESGQPLAQVAEVKLAGLDRGRVRIEVPAGSYEFSAPW